ncbi:hypothetical protein FNV43_RR03593 [Rhamnella rubrinervis]|uniref:AAA+ ATPase domain-containing protein n=1 Tax=Rhamnella rubrinervis TaxID=2594499 RepID=A0A8K0MNU4_9ROSA|nr:hypothetical protein FNV43_RR03593 [Rhamnella rubrinervis]
MVDILIDIAAKVAEYTVEPICRQLGYLFSYQKNVEDLNTKIGDLKNVKESLQHEVVEAQGNGENIEAVVNEWVTKVDKIITEDHGNFTRDEERANSKFTCGAKFPNLVLRHRLSRRAKKMAETVAAQIQDREKIKKVAYRPPPSYPVENKGYEKFESRSQTIEGIIKALKDPSVAIVGVWGMGGVGKTMLAEEVARRVIDEEKFFTRTVSTTVSNDQNIEKIQQEIGEQLGMQFDEQSKKARAERLRNRLRSESDLLIILDDIWNKLDLKDVGIPFAIHQKGCKILLTTRFSDVLDRMDVETNGIFNVSVLLEHEATRLFRQIVGDQTEKDDDFQGLEAEIVKECGGLPIAITTVASALKNKYRAVWENALLELRKSNPTNIPDMHEKVYKSIKLSFDFLESKEAKHLLLLCSLFPEDAHIEIRVLCIYGFGLNWFENVNTLGEARNRTDTLVANLKDRSLLLGGDNYVKLHDVIRDVVIFIVSKLDDHPRMHNIRGVVELDKYVNEEMSKDSTAMSVYGIKADQYPQTLKAPELKLLRLVLGYGKMDTGKLPSQFFEGLNKLLVLDSARVSLEPLSAASSFCLLPNLTTLRLNYCSLGDISWIGELVNLKILDLSFSSSFTKLPREIGNLSRLRSLNLEGCRDLDVIEPNVISSLTRLEELNLKESFRKWQVIEGAINDDERRNASLSEVKNLSHLIDLNLRVPDINSVPKDIFRHECKLVKYYMQIGIRDESRYWDYQNASSMLKLKLRPDSELNEHDFEALLKKSESLDLCGLKSVKSIAFEIDSMGFKYLEHLSVKESAEIRCIVNSNNGNMDILPAAFPSLESLFLESLMNLENIIHARLTIDTSFGNLREIKVIGCPKMKSLFSLYNIPRQLEKIVVWNCEMMEEIISHHGREGVLPYIQNSQTETSFGKLREIRVRTCPKMKSLFSLYNIPRQLEIILVEDCEMMEEIISHHGREGVLPNIMEEMISQLWKLRLERLPKLVQFIGASKCDETKSDKQSLDDSVAPLFNGQVVFPKLEVLDIGSLNIRKIWNGDQLPSSRFGFQSLTTINVMGCDHLKGLIPSFMTASLVNLRRLSVHHCKAVKEIVFIEESAQEMANYISFSKLEYLELDDLPNLERFFGGDCVDCPSLSQLTIRGCRRLRLFKTNAMQIENENSTPTVSVDKQLLSHHKDVVKDELSTESSCSEITCQPHPLGPVEEHHEMVFKTKRLSELRLQDFPYLQQLPKTFQTVEFLVIWEWGVRLKDLATPLICFQNLKFLMVKDCQGLTSLLSPSTAKSLSQRLTKLGISGCKSLRQVIVNDQKEADDDEIGADNINIIFRQLKSLLLEDLSSLTSFYSGNNNVVLQFPHLNQLVVGGCPEMKTFYHGNIDCPSLQRATIFSESVQFYIWCMMLYSDPEYFILGTNNEHFYWKGDVNTTIQKLWEDKNIIRDSPESEEDPTSTGPI